MTRISFAIAAVITLGLCSVAYATTWSFGGVAPDPGQAVGGNSLTITAGGISITATGYGNLGGPLAARNLFRKFTTGDPTETGLGFADEINHEIDTGGFIVLDLGAAALANQALGLTITSIQSGENYAWYHGNTLNTSAAFGGLSLVSTGITTSPLLFTAGTAFNNKYIAIKATSANVLLNTLATVPAVPEPRFYGLLLAGMLAIGGVVYRRRRVTE